MIDLRRIAGSLMLATVALIVLLGMRPIRVETIFAGYALVVAALALTGLTAAIAAARETTPSRFEQALRRERSLPSRPPELVRVERELTLAASSAGHFHARLRPLLWSIAEARGGGLDDATRELLRPDAPPPPDPAAPGIPRRRVKQIVDVLERL